MTPFSEFRASPTHIQIALDDSPDTPSAIDTSHNIPSYHLVKLANNITYQRYKKTIQCLKNSQNSSFTASPLYEMLEKMFSNYEGLSRKMPICRESPENLKIREDQSSPGGLIFKNKNLNKSQQKAIEFCLNPDRVLSCIQGPPGTGKTTTVVELILQYQKLGLKVLAVAPSNIAVDNILSKLADQGESSLSPGKVLRLGHPARIKIKQTENKKKNLINYSIETLLENSEQKQLAEDIKKEISSCTSWKEKKLLFQDLRDREKRARKEVFKFADVILGTTTSVVFGHKAELSQGSTANSDSNPNFDVVIIDEASQCIEMAALQSVICAKKLVLAGDHMQLPPTVLSHQAAKTGLNMTLLERSIKYFGQEVHKLLQVQYRMNEKIMKWSNFKFYENLVESDPSCKYNKLDLETGQNCPVIEFIDTTDCDFSEFTDEAGSTGNYFEAEIIKIQCERLVKDFGVKASEIGVVTPYNAQTSLIKGLLGAEDSLRDFLKIRHF